MNIHCGEVGVAGYYSFELNGVPVFQEQTKNLITDFGWNRISNLTSLPVNNAVIQVGTGNTTPAYTDVALASFLAQVVGGSGEATGTGTDSNGNYTFTRYTFSFALGAVVGNVTEVGFKVASGDASLSSRSLVKDGSGNPATITVTVTDTLTVKYELRYYRASIDFTSSVNVAGTPTTYTIRTGSAIDGLVAFDSGNIGGFNPTGISLDHYGTGVTFGAVNTDPSGSPVAALNSVSMTASISVGTGTTTVTIVTPTIAQASGNSVGGVVVMSVRFRAISIPRDLGAYGNIKAQFSPAIPKNNTRTLSYTFSFTFTRL